MCKYVLVDTSFLPDAMLRVLKAKELFATGKYDDITTVLKEVGISKSAYYKYRYAVKEIKASNINFKINDENAVIDCVVNADYILKKYMVM